MKDQIYNKLNYYFDLAVKEVTKRRRVISIQISGEHIDIPVSNILYMESQGRLIVMHLINDFRTSYQFYGNMTELEQKLDELHNNEAENENKIVIPEETMAHIVMSLCQSSSGQ